MGDEERFHFNGVDVTTGSYLLPPLEVEAVSRLARGERLDPHHLDELRWRHARSTEATFGPAEGVDPRDIGEAGWGVIVAAGDADGVLDALAPLLDHRRREATRHHERRYQQFTGERAYRPGESKQEFLARNGVGPGPADPDQMPYYLLLVGEPGAIPYAFQYQLDVQYAVGRLSFPTLEDYASYAAAVVEAETTPATMPTSAAFFAPHHDDDPATTLSAAHLVEPLADRLHADHPEIAVRRLIGEQADKAALVDLLGGATTPSMVFTASHGAGFPVDHPRQRRHQGALVCQDWPGPGRPIDDDALVCADDIGTDAALGGLIAFHFACFGAGTPAWDDYGFREGRTRRPLAPEPFVAALPQRLLAHGRGGALAVAGHVDRAWGYSFVWPGAGRQTEVYRSSLERLLAGHPVGSAFEYINERYAELASDLAAALDDVAYGKRPDHRNLATMWTASNDARGFAILGDPAVRLRTTSEASTAARETSVVDTGPTVGGTRETVGRPTVPTGNGARDRPAEVPSRSRVTEPSAGPDGSLDAGLSPALGDMPEGAAAADLDYGLRDGLRQTGDRLALAVQHIAETLADTLERAADAMAVVEVATYTSDDPAAAVYDRTTRRFDGARLRALSRASIGGDVQQVVDDGEVVDGQLWACHAAMVDQAQRTRSEFLRTAGSAASGLWDALRPGG